MYMFTIDLAGIPVEIDNRYGEIERISRDFLTDEPPRFTVRATDAELESELALGTGASVELCESIVLYRKIAERLPAFDALVFHSAVVVKDGRAYAITARSGVGKTTHLRLWLKAFGDEVYILNGDKPTVRKIDGTLYVAGTPWRGKEGYGRAGLLPLCGIAFLKRAAENSAETVTPEQALEDFMMQIYVPKNAGALKTLALADEILQRVPLIRLHVNMDISAPRVALEAFLNGSNKI